MGGAWKKNVSFYEAEHFVLFFRNASFCGLYVIMNITGKRQTPCWPISLIVPVNI